LSPDGRLPEPKPEESGVPSDLSEALERALDGLPEGYREAIQLTKSAGLSIAEAAEVLGTTETAVKLRIHRGYNLLAPQGARALRQARMSGSGNDPLGDLPWPKPLPPSADVSATIRRTCTADLSPRGGLSPLQRTIASLALSVALAALAAVWLVQRPSTHLRRACSGWGWACRRGSGSRAASD
jgi:hypothetical protein